MKFIVEEDDVLTLHLNNSNKELLNDPDWQDCIVDVPEDLYNEYISTYKAYRECERKIEELCEKQGVQL